MGTYTVCRTTTEREWLFRVYVFCFWLLFLPVQPPVHSAHKQRVLPFWDCETSSTHQFVVRRRSLTLYSFVALTVATPMLECVHTHTLVLDIKFNFGTSVMYLNCVWRARARVCVCTILCSVFHTNSFSSLCRHIMYRAWSSSLTTPILWW